MFSRTLKSVARLAICLSGSAAAFYLAFQVNAVATWPTAILFLLGGLFATATFWPILAYRGTVGSIPTWIDLLILRIGAVLVAAAAITYYSASWTGYVNTALLALENHPRMVFVIGLSVAITIAVGIAALFIGSDWRRSWRHDKIVRI